MRTVSRTEINTGTIRIVARHMVTIYIQREKQIISSLVPDIVIPSAQSLPFLHMFCHHYF